MKKKALFLDRDGVINVDYGYVHSPDNFEFIDGIFELVAAANQLGYLVVVVTNQAGIGRGYYNEEQFQFLTDWMKRKFVDHGCLIDGVYFCPYHPIHGKGKYLKESFNRKPSPGMIFKAQTELSIELSSSTLIGDSMTDVQAAIAAGVGRVFLFNENKEENLKRDTYVEITSLLSAISYLREISNKT